MFHRVLHLTRLFYWIRLLGFLRKGAIHVLLWWCVSGDIITISPVYMATTSNGNLPITGEFPAQRPVTTSFDVGFFYLCLSKRLGKQSQGWWYETPSRSLSRRYYVIKFMSFYVQRSVLFVVNDNKVHSLINASRLVARMVRRALGRVHGCWHLSTLRQRVTSSHVIDYVR